MAFHKTSIALDTRVIKDDEVIGNVPQPPTHPDVGDIWEGLVWDGGAWVTLDVWANTRDVDTGA